MGVKALWPLLESAHKRKELSSFSGRRLAIDLGFWLCQMQTAVTGQARTTANVVLNRIYLRTLFFRLSALLQMNVNVIVVTEGRPPKLKSEAIRSRLLSRTGSNGDENHSKKGSCVIRRNRFQRSLNECIELVNILGLPVVEAEGEAEATCAALCLDGLVDAVVTDDSDAFLYGATCVLRNFTLDGKEPIV